MPGTSTGRLRRESEEETAAAARRPAGRAGRGPARRLELVLVAADDEIARGWVHAGWNASALSAVGGSARERGPEPCSDRGRGRAALAGVHAAGATVVEGRGRCRSPLRRGQRPRRDAARARRRPQAGAAGIGTRLGRDGGAARERRRARFSWREPPGAGRRTPGPRGDRRRGMERRLSRASAARARRPPARSETSWDRGSDRSSPWAATRHVRTSTAAPARSRPPAPPPRRKVTRKRARRLRSRSRSERAGSFRRRSAAAGPERPAVRFGSRRAGSLRSRRHRSGRPCCVARAASSRRESR